jgi:hypothetical protein
MNGVSILFLPSFKFVTLTCPLSRDNVKHLTDCVSNAHYKGFVTHHGAKQYYDDAKRSCKVRVVRNPGDNELYSPLDRAI